MLIDSGDPRNWETRGINGFLGVPDANLAQLRGAGRDEARWYDVALIDARVLRAVRAEVPAAWGVNLHDDRFSLYLTDSRTIVARCVPQAIGLHDVWPDIPGLEQAYGANAHVCSDGVPAEQTLNDVKVA